MAIECPVGFDIESLREHVQRTYERVARAPASEFHFHRGGAYAIEYLGYDPAEVALVPRTASDRFAGVGNPLAVGPIHAGEVVLDHACGAGMDLLIAARRVGPTGRAIGVDMTPAMRACALRAASEAGLSDRVDVRAGLFEHLPVDSGSVDVVLSNGVVNLAPDKARVFREIARVLKPGGRLYLADVAVARELRLSARENPELWAACIGGALPENEFEEAAARAGLVGGRLVARFECFKNTSAEARVSTDLDVHGVSFFATRA